MESSKSVQIRQRNQLCSAEQLLAKKWSSKTSQAQRTECTKKLDKMLKNMQEKSHKTGIKG